MIRKVIPLGDWFYTGSFYFYGDGKDKDVVVRRTDALDAYCDAKGYSVNTLVYPGTFASIKEGIYDYIIVDDIEYAVWMVATRTFQKEFAGSPTLRAHKDLRVALFEALKTHTRDTQV